MSTTKGNTASVLERFPNDWHLIVQLSQADEEFRELCEHYTQCQAILTRLRDSTDADQSRLCEYETTTRELEFEIARAVEATGLRGRDLDGQPGYRKTLNP
jgi:hypothetical protein